VSPVVDFVENFYMIAQILDISPLTVKHHVQKILRQIKVANRAGRRQGHHIAPDPRPRGRLTAKSALAGRLRSSTSLARKAPF
jgi:hypothetical protein